MARRLGKQPSSRQPGCIGWPYHYGHAFHTYHALADVMLHAHSECSSECGAPQPKGSWRPGGLQMRPDQLPSQAPRWSAAAAARGDAPHGPRPLLRWDPRPLCAVPGQLRMPAGLPGPAAGRVRAAVGSCGHALPQVLHCLSAERRLTLQPTAGSRGDRLPCGVWSRSHHPCGRQRRRPGDVASHAAAR